MRAGGGPAEVVQHGAQLAGLGEVVPVEVVLVGRELVDDEADAAELRPAEQPVGVRLQRPAGQGGAVAVVEEPRRDLGVVDRPARRRAHRLLHRQDDVVVERLGRALDEHVVGGQPGAADAEAAAADDVVDGVGDVRPALAGRDRVEVGGVGGEDLLALVVVEAAHARPVAEDAVLPLDLGEGVEQGAAAALPRALEGLADRGRRRCAGSARTPARRCRRRTTARPRGRRAGRRC